MSVYGGTAENICSQRVFRILTHLRHWPDRNSAVQQSRSHRGGVLYSTPAVHGPAAPLSIQNNSGLSQGLAGRSAAGSACGKPTNGAKARGTPDVWHKAARVHIAYRGCGDSLAARGPRAAARKAGADWISVIQLPARHLS